MGAGCHFSIYDYNVDQFDGWANNQNLVSDQWCQCNYKLKGNGWGDWVEQWVYHGQNKPGFEWMGCFLPRLSVRSCLRQPGFNFHEMLLFVSVMTFFSRAQSGGQS